MTLTIQPRLSRGEAGAHHRSTAAASGERRADSWTPAHHAGAVGSGDQGSTDSGRSETAVGDQGAFTGGRRRDLPFFRRRAAGTCWPDGPPRRSPSGVTASTPSARRCARRPRWTKQDPAGASPLGRAAAAVVAGLREPGHHFRNFSTRGTPASPERSRDAAGAAPWLAAVEPPRARVDPGLLPPLAGALTLVEPSPPPRTWWCFRLFRWRGRRSRQTRAFPVRS